MATTAEATGTGRAAVLVGPDWLEQHLADPTVRVVEVDVSPLTFDRGHIPGAVLWNVYRDLKDADYHPVDPAGFGRLVAGSGIDPGSTVVFYGYAPAIGFWLMKLHGHADVRILDCSRATWHDAGRPWTTEAAAPAPTAYLLPDPDPGIRAGYADVRLAIDDPGGTLIDVRTEAEYDGERFWPSGGMEEGGRAGHVPTAVRVPVDGVYDEQGSFRPEADLRRVFAPVDLAGDGDLITYCTIGGRAATAWFVLTQLLGRDRVRVYDGSWAEWGKLPDAPVAAGVVGVAPTP